MSCTLAERVGVAAKDPVASATLDLVSGLHHEEMVNLIVLLLDQVAPSGPALRTVLDALDKSGMSVSTRTVVAREMLELGVHPGSVLVLDAAGVLPLIVHPDPCHPEVQRAVVKSFQGGTDAVLAIMSLPQVLGAEPPAWAAWREPFMDDLGDALADFARRLLDRGGS